MSRMRWNLSTLLILLTFVVITGGLGLQIYQLKQQVSELKKEVTRLSQSSPTSLPAAFPQPGRQSQQNQKSPFRLLNNEININSGIENGMKAGEWELKHRLEERRDRDEIPSPKTPDRQLEKMFPPLSERSAN